MHPAAIAAGLRAILQQLPGPFRPSHDKNPLVPSLANFLRTLCAVLLFTTTGGGAHAQRPQWLPPGTIPETKETLEEDLEIAIEEARWKAGPVRIEPWIGLRNAAYIDNIFTSVEGEEEADFTLTAGAGLRFFLPIGDDTVLTMHALPEYVYWQDLEARRRLNGRYGAGLFGFYNRLSTELTATVKEEQRVVTPEFQQYTNIGEDQVSTKLNLQLVRSLYVFAEGHYTEYQHLLDEQGSDRDPRVAALTGLDREEEAIRGGLQIKLGDNTALAAGVEHESIEFQQSGFDRSGSGTSPFVTMSYEGPVLEAELEVVDRELEPDGPTSIFVPFSDTTGHARVGLSEERRVGVDIYGRRELIYALEQQWAWFIDQSVGAALRFSLGERSTLSFFGELGDHEYESFDPLLGDDRVDDVTSFGFQLSYKLSERLTLSLVGSETEYDSNLPLLDRKVSYLGFAVELGELGWP